ncbi:serine--tRNA ligase [Buchnera aphidicola]|uniref:Serine--tRNA ligase n=1 Tax=Buchnera aphidicola (Anoecia oenotherae) TaxID=1241833 RepID=A0A4D6Y0J2_9GAMM|nr:serine--tRNA ligase [Buchnera aphidicola]QCI19371.1 serine--tRNA ligase [Buchnera aphidicola (Anoecia oenotherae)]
MLDPILFRIQPELIKKKLKTRGFNLDIHRINTLESKRKILQLYTENLQKNRNHISKLIGKFKLLSKKNSHLKKKVVNINNNIQHNKKNLSLLKRMILQFYLNIPNIPHKDTPIGKNNTNNHEISKWGDKYKKTNILFKNHIQLGNNVFGFDSNPNLNISGSQFIIMKNKIALLHRALGQFMLDLHTIKHGYSETYIPYIVNSDCLYGTGQLPKFKEELFHIYSKNKKNLEYSLIPTSEVPLINLFKNKLINKNDLPILLTAYSPCFRSENYSYGQNTKGLIRTHQFEKVEIIQIVHPKKSSLALENITHHAEKVLKLLKLPYRKVLLCSQDLGFSASKTYDLEVWFPSMDKYIEVSSCSNMLDFQSRRINLKYSRKKNHKNKFLHTLNASGLAVGRTLAAIIENYQHADGKIEIPTILQKKYMNGLKFIQ